MMVTYLIAVEDPGLGYDAETFPHTRSLGFSIATASWRSFCRSRAPPDNPLVVPVILNPDETREEEHTMLGMQKITPCLWFDAQVEEAAKFYTAIFKHSRIVSVTRYGKIEHEVHGMPA